MKRLSLEELKAQNQKNITKMNADNLESINGGNVDWCHVWHEIKTAVRAALDSDYGSAYVNSH